MLFTDRICDAVRRILASLRSRTYRVNVVYALHVFVVSLECCSVNCNNSAVNFAIIFHRNEVNVILYYSLLFDASMCFVATDWSTICHFLRIDHSFRLLMTITGVHSVISWVHCYHPVHSVNLEQYLHLVRRHALIVNWPRRRPVDLWKIARIWVICSCGQYQ